MLNLAFNLTKYGRVSASLYFIDQCGSESGISNRMIRILNPVPDLNLEIEGCIKAKNSEFKANLGCKPKNRPYRLLRHD